MKNLKKLVPVIALILGLGIAFGATAFKPSKDPVTLTYRYIGTDELGLTDIDNWEPIPANETPLPCDPGTELPCIVSFTDEEYDDITDFYTTHDTAAEMFSSLTVVNKKD
jgi:hypothetical protein